MISPHTIARILERTDIVVLIGKATQLTRRDQSFLGLCPFHVEQSPSFSVSASHGYFYCAQCKQNGNAIDFLMRHEGMPFPEAVRLLAKRVGIEIEDALIDTNGKSDDDLYKVNALAASFFELALRGAPDASPLAIRHHAIEELARHGLELSSHGEPPSYDALQVFRIGYASFARDGLMTYLKNHGISPRVAERVGLIVACSSDGGYCDRFRHCLTLAAIDAMGRVIGFIGRVLPDPPEGEVPFIESETFRKQGDYKTARLINSPIYTNDEHLFGLYQAREVIRQTGEVVLVKDPFDVIALSARGIQNVVAPLGTIFTERQAKLLKRFAANVTFAFEGDAPWKATWVARGPCRAAGLTARAANLPRGMAPDAMSFTTLEMTFKNATPLKQYILHKLLNGGDFRSANTKDQMARARAAVTLVGEEERLVERGILKAHADQLSSSLMVDGVPPTGLLHLKIMLELKLHRPERGG